MSLILTAIILLSVSGLAVDSTRHYDSEYLGLLREEVRQMFTHAYDSYLKYAFPYDELRPLSCDGVDTWGSYSLTLIDALDTLAVMGNFTEFRRVVDIIIKNADFVNNNINVSVFETNIRIIGGLLSAHLLLHKAGVEVAEGWPCNGPLLELAENVAHRVIAAFDTATGMPYGTVNLQKGVPHNETTITCTAGVGTFILEFSTLSHLTGDPIYEELAMNALLALWHHRSAIGLVGNHIDIQSGRWTAHDSGIGAGVDSYFEYLAKGALFLQKPELMHMFLQYRKMIDKYLKTDDWYMWASMSKGQLSLLVFQSLEAFWPGVLSLIGDVTEGMKSIHNYHQVWKQYGFTPEFYNIPQNEAGAHRESYPLRPELIESVMYLYRATGDSYLLQVGEDILRSIQHSSYTPCGYATIKNVRDHRKDDRMESFFLAETTKYLYLLFDHENFMHNNGQHGTVFNTPWGECIIDAGGYFYNTEAHPTDTGALHCCSSQLQEQVRDTILDFDPTVTRGEKLSVHRQKMVQKSQQTPVEKEEKLVEVQDALKRGIEIESGSQTEGAVPAPDSHVGTIKHNGSVQDVPKETEFKDDAVHVTAVSYETSLDTHKHENLGRKVELDAYLVDEDHSNSSNLYLDDYKDVTTEQSGDDYKWRPSEEDEDDRINLSSILGIFFNTEKRRTFEPQLLIEKIRNEKKYPRNMTWETQYELLRCQAQPYVSRITLNGEFYTTP
ncbi:ER degradation-enhancing alpha-mannosidase-like protein 2 [Polyplax serrata]|uniref:alpha-1,2-Mannosidase n=1 Tax=Polyplax serrata TaxID=468196 RepID=A0AAN8S613_POLSC